MELLLELKILCEARHFVVDELKHIFELVIDAIWDFFGQVQVLICLDGLIHLLVIILLRLQQVGLDRLLWLAFFAALFQCQNLLTLLFLLSFFFQGLIWLFVDEALLIDPHGDGKTDRI